MERSVEGIQFEVRVLALQRPHAKTGSGPLPRACQGQQFTQYTMCATLYLHTVYSTPLLSLVTCYVLRYSLRAVKEITFPDLFRTRGHTAWL